MKISRLQLKRIILESQFLLEEFENNSNISPSDLPKEEDIHTIAKYLEEGVKKAESFWSPSIIMDGLGKISSTAGFEDPCEYMRLNQETIADDLEKAQAAYGELYGPGSPNEKLEKLKNTMAVISGLSLFAWWKTVLPAAASQAIAGIAFFNQQAAATTLLGLGPGAWTAVGITVASLGILTWLYKLMLNNASTTACTIKEFAASVANGIGSAISSVVSKAGEFISDFVTWAKDGIASIWDWITNKDNDKSITEALYGDYRKAKAIKIIKEWNAVNHYAILIATELQLAR